MWSPIVFCFLVGFACAVNNSGWRNDAEYVYRIEGRSLASLQKISSQQSGFLYEATLRIQPQSNGRLRAQISKAQYDEIHSDLPRWFSSIPQEQLSWKPLKMSDKPFEVEMEGNRIISLIVSETTPVWEANIIKSIMSQFQITTHGANIIRNNLNILPENEEERNGAVFMAMEDTVTGNCETLYQIRTLPEYLVQSYPNEAQYLDADENGKVIEIFKTKNFTNNVELPAYSYGFRGLNWGKPATNQMGEFFTRSSHNRIFLTGNLKRFVIRSSLTTDQIFTSPTLSAKKSAVVASFVNATLKKIKSPDQQIPEVPQPINLGNLVYSYEKPFSQSNKVHAKPAYQWRSDEDSREQETERMSNNIRLPRSLHENKFDDENNGYKQKLSDIKEPPASPLLPLTMGYEGTSIKNKINVVQEVQKLANEIGQRMQEAERDHHEELLDMFASMVSLIRIMNVEEVQQAAKDLYSNKKHGLERAIWTSFRDGVAESGTGPAFLVVKEWLQTQKIEGEEASQVATTTITNVRQPSLEYFRSVFELVKQPIVLNQWPLNNTILLAYSDLIRKVYVSEEEMKLQFPANSFEPFNTEEGKTFINQEVMPFYKQQLIQAIQRSETHKIHAFIRIIGNTGSYDILPIFEPFLEGKQQVSQFQRVLMILAMNKLVDVHPKTARSVLFRIYQNPAETREVRLAAVYQLMRTVPPTRVLQVMAQYTNVDSDYYVAAAVKSSIETAASLNTHETAQLRKSALMAKPLLTRKLFGLQHGANYLRAYFINELKTSYKQVIDIFGSDDSMYPKGITYTLRRTMGGMKTRIVNMQAMISSIDDLIQIGKEQTESYKQQESQQRQQSQEQEKNQWSSQNIAKLLNMQPEDQEQLEGFMKFEFMNYQNLFSFDNRTIESYWETIRDLEETYKNEKDMSIFKLTTNEMALSFPTEVGVPFLFTYDIPMLFKAQGKVSATAQPQLSQNKGIKTPEQIELKSDMSVSISTKTQSRVSITAPFNHKQYFAGFDKHFEINMPTRVQVQVDIKNMNAEIEVELKPAKKHNLFHYVTRPYTSKVDVTSFEPMTGQQNTKFIKQRDLQAFDTIIGKKSTGMAFRFETIHSRTFLDTFRFVEILKNQQLSDAFQSIWDDKTIQFSLLNVFYLPQESTARKAHLRLSYENKYRSRPESDSSSEWILDENVEPSKRQEELMKKTASDIKNVQVVSLDSKLEFKGKQNIRYTCTGALAKSNVDPKSRVMFSYKRSSNGSPKAQELHFDAKSYILNTNSLDLEFALQNEPTAETEIKMKFGNSEEPLSKIEAQLRFRRSAGRKQYLKELPMYKQCKDEMRAGNKQLPTCRNMTEVSSLLDSVDMKIRYENIESEWEKYVQRYFHTLQSFAEPNIEIINKDLSSSENEIKMQAQFHPDLRAVNVTVKTQTQESIFKNIEIDEFSEALLVVHPVFHVGDRLSSQYFTQSTYRDNCVVDKTHINTFSNLTYPANISKHWTVMLQYIAGNSQRDQQSIQEQLRAQTENYVVLVRENPESANKKDVKIVVSTPESDYKIVDIEMSPSQGSSEPIARITVDGQEVKVNEKESHDIKEGFIQMYALPNNEVKIEVRNAFQITYDGSIAMITTTNGKFKKSLVGLCGQYTLQKADDLTTPQACVARDPEDFVRSYEVEGQKGQEIRTIFQTKTKKCVEKDIPIYTDVITARDYRAQQEDVQSDRCTFFQTQYVQENSQICFTIRAQPTCSSQCQPRKLLSKNIPVHCVSQNSKVAELWKKQIDNGSSPDFSGQQTHKFIKLSMPESCSK